LTKVWQKRPNIAFCYGYSDASGKPVGRKKESSRLTRLFWHFPLFLPRRSDKKARAKVNMGARDEKVAIRELRCSTTFLLRKLK
jgi:hypothetical protein